MTKRELELLDEALDDVEATPEQIASTMSRLSITPAAWAVEVRARAEAAKEAARQARLRTEPKLRVIDGKKPRQVELRHEPTEMTGETKDNLWRVLLEGAQERGQGALPSVHFYRRRFAISPIWILIALVGVLAILAIVRACA